MDRTEPEIKRLLLEIKPDIIFFDFTHWVPKLARRLGIIVALLHYKSCDSRLYFVSDKERRSDARFYERLSMSLREADPLAYRTCKETVGKYLDYLEREFSRDPPYRSRRRLRWENSGLSGLVGSRLVR
ncbi:hypothetical protein FNV43_RR12877 [Rhamnella rubrinervis]|uniref:Uncharacterized protein n=1 Tax=Rhamnella rubrinervis TaxID=2594499 RepID=A0A8K0MED9_9ROSA|nr:hypothetical protein FNV43_RR12877 [Rhamnella rubrinervis]